MPGATEWKKGQSGNPAGSKPRSYNAHELRDLCRQHTQKAVETLIALMDCNSPAVQQRAADSILDRAWGKPSQAIEMTGSEGGPLQVTSLVDVIRCAAAAEIKEREGKEKEKEDEEDDGTP